VIPKSSPDTTYTFLTPPIAVFKTYFIRNPNNRLTFSKKIDTRVFDRNLYFYVLGVQKSFFSFAVVTFQIDAPRLSSSVANITNMLKPENI
jgi:hypothetical protein